MIEFAVLTVISLVGLTLSKPINVGNYKHEDIITRDVCIVGGGSTGTYSAVRLGDFNKSVVVVEMKGRLGGHTETYVDLTTKLPLDIGVVVFSNLSIVTNHFARFNVSLIKADFPPMAQRWTDFQTGKVVKGYTPPNTTAVGNAFGAYKTQLLKYPGLNEGFYLPSPVPEDLLLPFGDFVKKFSLDAAAYTIFQYTQSMGDLANTATLYVMKVFGLDLVQNIATGLLTATHGDTSALYRNAEAALLPDLLLNSTVIEMDRSSSDCIRIEVSTPTGRKLIQAKKLLVTIPPVLKAMHNFDLSETERELFGQFDYVGYYTALVRHDGLSNTMRYNSIAANTSFNLPVLPGIFQITPTTIPGLHAVKYGVPSPVTISDHQVQQEILSSIAKLGADTAAGASSAEFAVFSSHSPFGLRVSTDAIRGGFYEKFYALQGVRNTFYTGAAFEAHDSAMLWTFTERILPALAA